MRIVTIMLVLALLTGCKSRSYGPVAIEADDACASCRMAISERRYAAELVDRDGSVYKFDDIACMLRFARARGIQNAAPGLYVTDYETGTNWIDARGSYFAGLKTSVSSPMGSGIVAFRSAAQAQQIAGNKFDHALTFQELFTEIAEGQQTNKRDVPATR